MELNEFLANVHLRILTINGIEVHLQGMSFRAIELDEKGEASFTFTPIRPGDYPVYVGPNPFGLGRPAGEQGVQNDPKVAFATIHATVLRLFRLGIVANRIARPRPAIAAV